MGFFQHVLSYFQPTKSQALVTKDSLSSPSSNLFYALGAYPSNTGIPTSPLASLQIAAAYACIRALCDDLSKLSIHVQRKLSNGGWDRFDDHPVQKLINYPNDHQTHADLISHLVLGVNLRGNSYAYVQRRGNGDPKRIVPILFERCAVLLSEQGDIYYSASSPHIPSEALNVDHHDMLHVRNISLDGGVTGISPIAAAQDVLGISLAAQRHAALLYRQGTMPGGHVKLPGRLSPEAMLRFQQSFQQAYSGSDNSYKTIILEDGAEFVASQFSAEDSQLLESRRFSVEEVCRVFGVPPHRVASLDRSTFSNIEQQAQDYIDESLLPIAGKIERQMERVLLFDDERDKTRIRFDFDEMLRGDTKSRFEAHQIALLNGVKSINEVREQEGYAPIGGGDEHRVPLNTGPAAAKPGDTSPETDVSAAPADDATEPEAKPDDAKAAKPRRSRKKPI